MTITKRPAAGIAAAIDEFISRAPDAGKGGDAKLFKRGKVTISLGVDPNLLARIDSLAVKLGISRAAAIATAIARLTEANDLAS